MTHTNIIKKGIPEIENLKSKSYYLIYNRKSTDEPDSQKNSISYQTVENLAHAKKHNLLIPALTIEGFCKNGVITERHSAFKENDLFYIDDNGNMQYQIERPKFAKLVQLLHQGYIKGVVVLCFDRISRNKSDETIIRRLMKLGVDFQFTLTTYDTSSSGALHMDIDGMFAIHHSRVTSEKVKLAITNKRTKGHFLNQAPVGYLNIGSSDSKPIDTLRAPLIKELFEMYATGNYSVSELTTYANSLGITMPKRRKRRTSEEILSHVDDGMVSSQIERPFSRSAIHRILQNQFYTGKVKGNNNDWIVSNCHEALVQESTFWKVQQLLKGRNQSVKHITPLEYPFRGCIRCRDCNRLYSPYIKKGIQYYMVKCESGCKNTTRNIAYKTIINSSETLFKELVVPEEIIDQICKMKTEDVLKLETLRTQQIEKLGMQKKKLEEDLKYLRDNKLELLKTSVYTPQEFLKEEQRLNLEISVIQFNENESTETLSDTLVELKKITELLKNLSFYMKMSNEVIQEKIIKTICLELLFSENTLTFKLKSEFDFLKQLNVSSCAPQVTLPELPILSHAAHECLITLQPLDLNVLTHENKGFHSS